MLTPLLEPLVVEGMYKMSVEQEELFHFVRYIRVLGT